MSRKRTSSLLVAFVLALLALGAAAQDPVNQPGQLGVNVLGGP